MFRVYCNICYLPLIVLTIISPTIQDSATEQSTSKSQKNSCKDTPEGYCNANSEKKLCEQTPQSYEGPFFLPNQPIRNDIREGHIGVPLKVKFVVKNTKCDPVENAQVHLWHADAEGKYSAYSGYYPLGDPKSKKITGAHAEPTEMATFLRGIQVTASDGSCNFTTIYPGWYRYRTLHAHFKITHKGEEKYSGEIYFPDELTDEIAKVDPYNQHNMESRLKNSQDGQFIHDNGAYLVMRPTGNVHDGLEGLMEIIV